jgi:hypothetical protein
MNWGGISQWSPWNHAYHCDTPFVNSSSCHSASPSPLILLGNVACLLGLADDVGIESLDNINVLSWYLIIYGFYLLLFQ